MVSIWHFLVITVNSCRFTFSVSFGVRSDIASPTSHMPLSLYDRYSLLYFTLFFYLRLLNVPRLSPRSSYSFFLSPHPACSRYPAAPPIALMPLYPRRRTIVSIYLSVPLDLLLDAPALRTLLPLSRFANLLHS